MKVNNKKRQIAKISIFITSMFVIFMSVTYAFITQTLTGTKEVVINAGVLDLVLEEENEITISDALPMYDAVGMIQEDVFVFRLVNKTENDTNYILKLQEIETGTLDKSIVKYGLIKEGEKKIDFVSNIVDGIIDEGTIDGNDTIDYELRLWIDSSVTEIEQVQSKFLSFRMSTSASQEIAKLPSFVDKLEEKVNTTSTIIFTKISSDSNGKGIYKYTEDGEDIYYWRGNINAVATEENGIGNHVIFGGYCWEMVRTTKTGGIKMIYDGTPVVVDGVKTCPNNGSTSQLGTKAFNTSYIDNAYVGYMYGLTGVTVEPSSPQCIKLNSAGTQAEIGAESTEAECKQAGGKWATTAYQSTHANVVNSTIKGVIDAWFSASELNIKKNLEKIEDAVYCNDRSIDTTYGTGLGYGINQTGYNARYRLYTNKTPSLECINENDRFTVSGENGNGDLTYPVGLLTADEIALAGGIFQQGINDTRNRSYYLYINQPYWTLSPYSVTSNYAQQIQMYSEGNLTNGYTYYSAVGVRPVISLVSGTTFAKDGNGTESNPYVVE